MPRPAREQPKRLESKASALERAKAEALDSKRSPAVGERALVYWQ